MSAKSQCQSYILVSYVDLGRPTNTRLRNLSGTHYDELYLSPAECAHDIDASMLIFLLIELKRPALCPQH